HATTWRPAATPVFQPTTPHARPCGEWSRLQFDVPVQIVAPAIVKIVGRETFAMILQLPAGRADRFALDMHVRLGGGPAALAKVARCAGGGDILPCRAPALRSWNHMVERQFPVRTAIDAAEAIAQEQVEARE